MSKIVIVLSDPFLAAFHQIKSILSQQIKTYTYCSINQQYVGEKQNERFPKSIGQIDLFKNYFYLIRPCVKEPLKKQLLKKCKYECIMNVIPKFLA